jgi:uncharacterized protein (DUF1800 family)
MLAIFLVCYSIYIFPQNYLEFIGAGHTRGVTVTTSHDKVIKPIHPSVDGEGMMPDLYSASRFLQQATLGSDYELIDSVANHGITQWIDDQIAIPPSYLKPYFDALMTERGDSAAFHGEEFSLDDDPNRLWRFSWWQTMMTSEDLLRHRIALALSEIIVISENSGFGNDAHAMVVFYDLLLQHAFGNYRDLLYDVTRNHTMGEYLSHWRNPKSDPSINRFPDENYAREVQQLFSIGLYQLNQDGSRIEDMNGEWIPTYSNYEIKEFSKVFTGFGTGGVNDNFWWWRKNNYVNPMKIFEDYHEPGVKYLHNDSIPNGQSGLDDVGDAIDNIFNHPNVGPFIGRLLIQRLVKSNPTPEYIFRVAGIFNDNGLGVRGDMEAVIKAILLDEEARDCSWMEDETNGKLREPIVRYTHFLKAFNAFSPAGKYHITGYSYLDATHQIPLASPSVFNFYLPDFQPKGVIGDADLVAPEFQIFDATTSIGFINEVHQWTRWTHGLFDPASIYGSWNNYPDTWHGEVDLTDEMSLVASDDLAGLLDRLDLILCYGKLSNTSRSAFLTSLQEMKNIAWISDEDTLDAALYLFLISPHFNILK